MKRAVIIHCWGGNPDHCWYPRTKKELEKAGFKVIVPTMPESDHPKLEGWLKTLSNEVHEADENLYLIGHSLGCITIMHYLNSLPNGKKIGGAVFVAGFTDDLGFEEIKNFFKKIIQLERIKEKSKHFMVIHSDNDPFVPLLYSNIFKEKLGAETVIKHNAGHFSGTVDGEEPCMLLPEVSQIIINWSKT